MIFQHPELAVNPHWKTAKSLKEGFLPSRRILTAFGVEDEWLERYPWELSGGQLARICLVRALGPDTRFIIADEITAMLDAVTQARIWNSLLEHVRQNKIGMMVISHDKHLISGICDRTFPYFDKLNGK
jgi:peptide/nickel transport system ATP-binding protein